MNQRTYAIKPTGDGAFGALTCVSSTISPWAGYGVSGMRVRHTNGAGWPMGLCDGSTG